MSLDRPMLKREPSKSLGVRILQSRGMIAFLAIIVVGAVLFGGYLLSPASTTRLTHELMVTRADLAARSLIAGQRTTGLFKYEFDFVADDYRHADNIVRQAASAAILAEYMRRTNAKGFMLPVAKAITELKAMSLPYKTGMVVSEKGLLENGSTGATAFAMLAAADYFEATGDRQFQDIREGWQRGLESLQLPTGGFAIKPDSLEESSYYNGEAWLAFAHEIQLSPTDEGAAKVLALADPYITDHYSRLPDSSFAHWGLMAGRVRYDVTKDPRMLNFISSLSESFLTKVKPKVYPDMNNCSMAEGLASAAISLIKGGQDKGDLYNRIVARLELEVSKSLEMQVLPDQSRLPLGKTRFLEDPGIADFAGVFLNGRYDARSRIDYTQHCLSALMKYDEYLTLR